MKKPNSLHNIEIMVSIAYNIMRSMRKNLLINDPNKNPLHIGKPFTNAAPSTIPPNFTYRGGPIMQSPTIKVIFWGDPWQQAFYGMPPKMDTFFTAILKGPLTNQLQEYNTPKAAIGQATYAGSIIVTNPKPWKFIFDSQIRSMLQQQIAQNTVPPVSPNTLYVIFTPPGSGVIKNVSISCINFCGYHDTINNNIIYSVINYPSCTSCKPNLPDIDALMVSASHEICEAITDPIPGSGWYDDIHGEIGDVCAWQTKKIQGMTVQKEWSQQNKACI